MMNKYTTDFIDLRGETAVSLLDVIQKAINKYGVDNVFFNLDTEWVEYSDNQRAVCQLECRRPMTDKEIKDRDAALDQQQKRIQEREVALLKELKAKYNV